MSFLNPHAFVFKSHTSSGFINPTVLLLHFAVIARPLAYSLSSKVDKNPLADTTVPVVNISSITIMNRNPDITHPCLTPL